MNTILFGDCRESLRKLAADGVKVQCVVTSPPYFGLRSYLPDGHPDKALEIGLEETPDQYVARMVEVFRAVRDVMDDDGTLWLNIGDSYAGSWGNQGRKAERGTQRQINGKMMQPVHDGRYPSTESKTGSLERTPGCKNKDLIGIPWLIAFALRADGWYLRQEIIWAKPNPMPESVRDRCTKSHESIFLLAKSERYYYDHKAIKEPAAQSSIARWSQDVESQRGGDRVPGKTNGTMKAVGGPRSKRDSFKRDSSKREQAIPGQGYGTHRPDREESSYDTEMRNRRSVWMVATRPYRGCHFATFPPALIEPCILAGSRPGDIVLDPFIGSGTTAAVALHHGRQYLGCELNEEYGPLQERRIADAVALLGRAAKKAPKPKERPAEIPEGDSSQLDIFTHAPGGSISAPAVMETEGAEAWQSCA